MLAGAIIAGFVIASLLLETIFPPPRASDETAAEQEATQ